MIAASAASTFSNRPNDACALSKLPFKSLRSSSGKLDRSRRRACVIAARIAGPFDLNCSEMFCSMQYCKAGLIGGGAVEAVSVTRSGR